tara:strand:- start:68 stop:502 length:435 start_codon:yes stop_codon:yes gene_type:complete
MSSLVNDPEVSNLNTDPVSPNVNIEISSMVEKTLEWVNEHKMFIIWGLIVLVGIVYFTYYRNVEPVEESKEIDDILGEDTGKLMEGLDINLKGKHLDESSVDEEEKQEDSDDGNLSNSKAGDEIDTISEDLNQLEEYTQESMDI